MKINTERRIINRVKVNNICADYRLLDPRFWAEARAQGKTISRDINLEGMSFGAEDVLPENSFLSLKLNFGGNEKTEDICARVIRVKKLKQAGYEIGVTFSWWKNDEDKINLMRFISPVIA